MNKAKCQLCKSIIQSFHQHDYVSCSCGEISIDGGEQNYRAFAKDWTNFLRVDDKGNEVKVTVMEKQEQDHPPEEMKTITIEDQMQMLKDMVEAFKNLPEKAMTAPITHYDFYASISLIYALMRDFRSSIVSEALSSCCKQFSDLHQKSLPEHYIPVMPFLTVGSTVSGDSNQSLIVH